MTVFNEICKLLDPTVTPYIPKRNKTNIIMFVGLQGSGKTTTVTKLAHYYQRQRFRPALICADTFRAGAFDQLKQNARNINIPFYGSYKECDPVKIAYQGVQKFKKGYNMIIVDTSGKHKQHLELFKEMQQLYKVIKPDEIIFVMDATIGQAAYAQAIAFKKSVPIGSVITTKMDGNAKGGGALSAVAATKSPITFIGTGERFQDFEPFKVKPFVKRLLGLPDIEGLVDVIKKAIPDKETGHQMIQNIQKGKFSLRDMYEQFQTMIKMGSFEQIISKMPSNLFSAWKGLDKNTGYKKVKVMLTIMDSMNASELDNPKLLTKISRLERIAYGSGHTVMDVRELIKQYRNMEKIVSKMKGFNPGNYGRLQHLANMIPQQALRQFGSSNLSSLIRQFQNKMGVMGGSSLGSLSQLTGMRNRGRSIRRRR